MVGHLCLYMDKQIIIFATCAHAGAARMRNQGEQEKSRQRSQNAQQSRPETVVPICSSQPGDLWRNLGSEPDGGEIERGWVFSFTVGVPIAYK